MLKKLRDLETGTPFRSHGKRYIKTDGVLKRDGDHWHGLCPDDGSVAFPLKTDEDPGTGDVMVEVDDKPEEN